MLEERESVSLVIERVELEMTCNALADCEVSTPIVATPAATDARMPVGESCERGHANTRQGSSSSPSG